MQGTCSKMIMSWYPALFEMGSVLHRQYRHGSCSKMIKCWFCIPFSTLEYWTKALSMDMEKV